jgi:hypothetical protein
MNTSRTITEPKDGPNDWIAYAVGFFVLSLPFSWGLLCLIERFQITSALLAPILIHPVMRSLVGAAGGLIVYQYLWVPRRQRSHRVTPSLEHARNSLNLIEGMEVGVGTPESFGPREALPQDDELDWLPQRLSEILEDDVFADDFDYHHSERLADLVLASEVEPTTTPPPGLVRLSVELIPESSWFINLRSAMTSAQWDSLRRRVYNHAGGRCEVCGARGRQWPVEAHETYSYDEEARVQRLQSVTALCPACHEVKHFGQAVLQGRDEEALEHLSKVNEWSDGTARSYLAYCWTLWRARSDAPWRIDLSLLSRYGFTEDEIRVFERGEHASRRVH